MLQAWTQFCKESLKILICWIHKNKIYQSQDSFLVAPNDLQGTLVNICRDHASQKGRIGCNINQTLLATLTKHFLGWPTRGCSCLSWNQQNPMKFGKLEYGLTFCPKEALEYLHKELTQLHSHQELWVCTGNSVVFMRWIEHCPIRQSQQWQNELNTKWVLCLPLCHFY